MSLTAKIYDLNQNLLYTFTDPDIIDIQYQAKLNYFERLEPEEVSITVKYDQNLLSDIRSKDFENTFTKWVDDKVIQINADIDGENFIAGMFILTDVRVNTSTNTIKFKAKSVLELLKKVKIDEMVVREQGGTKFLLKDWITHIIQKTNEVYPFFEYYFYVPSALNDSNYGITYLHTEETTAYELLKRIQKAYGVYVDFQADNFVAKLYLWGGMDGGNYLTVYNENGSLLYSSTFTFSPSNISLSSSDIIEFSVENPEYRFKQLKVKGKLPEISDVTVVYKGATPDQPFNVPDGGYPTGDDEFWVETEKELYELEAYSTVICEPTNLVDQTTYESNFYSLTYLVPKYPKKFKLKFNNTSGSTISLTNIEVYGKTIDYSEHEKVYEIENLTVYSLKNSVVEIEDDMLQTETWIERLSQWYGHNLGNKPFVSVKTVKPLFTNIGHYAYLEVSLNGIDSYIDNVVLMPDMIQIDLKNASFVYRFKLKDQQPTYVSIPKKEKKKTLTPLITPEGVEVPKGFKQKIGTQNDAEHYLYWDGSQLTIKGGLRLSGDTDLTFIDTGTKLYDGETVISTDFIDRYINFDIPVTEATNAVTDFQNIRFLTSLARYSDRIYAGLVFKTNFSLYNLLSSDQNIFGVSFVEDDATTTVELKLGWKLSFGILDQTGLRVSLSFDSAGNIDETAIYADTHAFIVPVYTVASAIDLPDITQYHSGSVFVWNSDLYFVDAGGNLRKVSSILV